MNKEKTAKRSHHTDGLTGILIVDLYAIIYYHSSKQGGTTPIYANNLQEQTTPPKFQHR